VGGANGANRLSGNAITEAVVFGARAGQSAARHASGAGQTWSEAAAKASVDMLKSASARPGPNPAEAVARLQSIMADKVGAFRTAEKLDAALADIEALSREIGDTPMVSAKAFDPVLVDWLDLRQMLLVARSVAVAAKSRKESRGAHQREDFPGLDEAWTLNQVVTLADGDIALRAASPAKRG
jgi:succinate dehydrogenase/fumarate reductase flavoprotein subunit